MSVVQDINRMLEDNRKYFIENEERLEKDKKQALKKESFDETARDLYEVHRSFIEHGFTDEQAWELLKIIVTNNFIKNK